MPTPKPSATTYMATATASSAAQTRGSQKAGPSRPGAKAAKLSSMAPSLRRLRAAGPAFEALVGAGERPFRLAVEPVVEAGAAHRFLQRLRPLPQELCQIVAAEAEDHRVGDEEGRERGGDGL